MATFPGNPAADPLTGAEIVPITQAGTDKRTTTQAIADLATSVSIAYTIVTEASSFTVEVGVHDGLATYTRAAGNATFDNAEPYTAGMTFPIRATASIELVEDGVTLTPPAGGSLFMDSGMAVQVIMTSATAGDVIGQTVASS